MLALTARADDAPRVVSKQDSPFGPVLVVDEGGLRHLRFGGVHGDDQTVIDPAHPNRVPLEYVRELAAALAFTPPAERALMIGLGGGAFARVLLRAWPDATLDAVEINPVVVDVARRYFALPTEERLRVHVGDGGRYLTSAKRRWGFIALDAYGSDDLPPHLATVAFFREARRHLAPGGVVAINLAVSDALEAKLRARFSAVFPHCVALRGPVDRNLILVGGTGPLDDKAAHGRHRKLRARLGDALAPIAGARTCRVNTPAASAVRRGR